MSIAEEAFPRTRTENQDYQNLKRDVEMLRKDVAKLSESLVASAKSSAQQVRQDVSKRADQAVHQVEARVTERPMLSILISLLSGMVVAKALSSKPFH